MEDDVTSSFYGTLDHLVYVPAKGSSLTSLSTSASTSSPSPSHPSPRRIWTAPSDTTQNWAPPPDTQRPEADRLRDRTQSKFFIQVPAVSLSKRKRKRGEGKKETKKRPRKAPSEKSLRREAPESRADEDGDARSVVERFLLDHVVEDLDVLFCGFNPGLKSAAEGHHYANPSNHFWPCLHLSGFTPTLLPASEDYTLPEKYNLGLTNLLDISTPSVSGLSRREMAGAAPTLLAKVARFRPRVVCFVGKGIWVHVEPLLRLQVHDNANGNDDQGNHGDGGGLVARATESCVMLKDEEMDDSVMPCASSATIVIDPDTRSVKAEPDLASFRLASDPASPSMERGHAPRKHLLTVTKPKRILGNKTTTPSMTAGKRRGVVASRASPKKLAPPSAFAYGLQPYKAVHDAVIKKANVRETLFCVFPSTSGRVVSHQRDDKVALFKTLRRNLERITAGTFDTSSMQRVRLLNDVEGQ